MVGWLESAAAEEVKKILLADWLQSVFLLKIIPSRYLVFLTFLLILELSCECKDYLNVIVGVDYSKGLRNTEMHLKQFLNNFSFMKCIIVCENENRNTSNF